MMEQDFKKSVAVFGLAIPMMVVALCVIALLVGKSKVNKSYQAKSQSYQKSQLVNQKMTMLKEKVAQESKVLDSWEVMLAAESRRSFTQHWKQVGQAFKSKEFQLELPSWKNKSSGLGSQVSQPASQVSMTFDATFRAMQIALMEMETRLPQMQLDSIQLKSGSDGETLNFKTQFTVWTAN